MTAAVIAIVLVYVVASVGLGLWAHARSRDTAEDYFVAERSLSWIPLGMTLFATWMSTFAFLGSPGFYYKNGVSWFLPHGFLVVGSPLLMWFIGRRIWALGRQCGYITPGELLADFYKSNTVRYLVAGVCLLALLPYSLVQLIGIGKVLEASTDGAIPYWIGVALAVFSIAVYTYLGGVRAIVLTDILQASLFGAMMLIGAGVALYAAGGLGEGYAASVEARPEAFVFDPAKVGSPLTLLIIWTFGYILLPHMWQRAYMARSGEALSRSIVLGSFLALILIAIPSLIMGTLGIGFLPDVGDSDKFVPTMYSAFLAGALPFLVLATFAAGMSTIDSQLLSAASVVVRDLVRPKRRADLSPHRERFLGRLAAMVLLLILVVLALSPFGRQGNIILLASKGTGIALLLLVPLCGPLLWSRASRLGAIGALVAGGVVMFLLETGLVSIVLPLSFGPPIAALVVQIPVFVVVSLGAPSVATRPQLDTD